MARRVVLLLVSLLFVMPVGFVFTAPPAAAQCAVPSAGSSPQPCCDYGIGDTFPPGCDGVGRPHQEANAGTWIGWGLVVLGALFALGLASLVMHYVVVRS